MKVILKQEVQKVGRALEIKEVKDGYGRNYLIPNGLAIIANKVNIEWLEKKKEQKAKKKSTPNAIKTKKKMKKEKKKK